MFTDMRVTFLLTNSLILHVQDSAFGSLVPGACLVSLEPSPSNIFHDASSYITPLQLFAGGEKVMLTTHIVQANLCHSEALSLTVHKKAHGSPSHAWVFKHQEG